jgi:hypothetical protein
MLPEEGGYHDQTFEHPGNTLKRGITTAPWGKLVRSEREQLPVKSGAWDRGMARLVPQAINTECTIARVEQPYPAHSQILLKIFSFVGL